MNFFRCALHGTLKSEKSGYVTLTTKIFAPGDLSQPALTENQKKSGKKIFLFRPF